MTDARADCPFTLAEYRLLLRLAKERFTFCDYHAFEGENRIIWRHDLEYSLWEMDKLAAINVEEGIVAVMFIQLRSPFYNAFSRPARALFTRWADNGLHLGLHFDWEFFADDLDNVERYLAADRDKLQELTGVGITSFSYHNPTETILAYGADMAGMANAYGPRFFRADGVHYVSDSNGRFRNRNFREAIGDPSVTRLQVNVHDTWWTDDRIPQIQKIERAFADDAAWKMKFYRDHANVLVTDVL